MWTALALILTVLMGGLIAYNGDLIGRKYGKRRVTLFNLRPKHTAILITSVTGVLISAFTTAIVFLLVPPVRDVIMHGEEAIRDNRIQVQKNLVLVRNNKDLEVRKTGLEMQIKDFEKRLATLTTDFKAALKDRDAAREQARIATAKTQEETRKLLAARSEKVKAETDLKTARAESSRIKEINVKLAEHSTQLASRNNDLQNQNSRLVAENAEKKNENKQIDAQNQEIAKQNLELSKVNAGLSGERDKLVEILGRNRIENDRLVGENVSLESKNKQLVSSNAELVNAGKGFLTDWQELLKRFETLRTKRIVIHGGEDLSRIVVPAHQSTESVRQYIDQLMSEANQAAIAKGARSGDQSSGRAVQIVDKQFITETPFGGLRPVDVTERDRIDAVVHKLTNSETPVCVLALAVANSPESEPAPIDFQPFNDWLVYPKGRQIGTRKMNATDQPEKIYMDLMSFLKDVGQTAIEKGMIPRIDPATGAPGVGSLDWPELVRLVEKVRIHQGRVRITAMALDDTKASDPLKLDFKVEASL